MDLWVQCGEETRGCLRNLTFHSLAWHLQARGYTLRCLLPHGCVPHGRPPSHGRSNTPGTCYRGLPARRHRRPSRTPPRRTLHSRCSDIVVASISGTSNCDWALALPCEQPVDMASAQQTTAETGVAASRLTPSQLRWKSSEHCSARNIIAESEHATRTSTCRCPAGRMLTPLGGPAHRGGFPGRRYSITCT